VLDTSVIVAAFRSRLGASNAALAHVADRRIEPVAIHFTWRPQLADPADEMVLEAAANGRADGIVTHNTADFAYAAARFGLAVVTPGTLLRSMPP
jgi:predicted nucleic acid-binding protein